MSRRKRYWIGGGIALVGGGAISAAWILTTNKFDNFASEGLLELGITLLLVIPLLIFERLFEQRVEDVRADTTSQVRQIEQDVGKLREETATQIGDLRDALEDQLARRREADNRAAEQAQAAVSFENLGKIFERAGELDSISKRGLRVQLPGLWERVRFTHVYRQEQGGVRVPMILLHLEDARGRKLDVSAIWTAEEGVTDLMTRFAEDWQRAGTYHGPGSIEADALFQRLIQSLQLAIHGRTTGIEGEALDRLVELPTTDWAITDFGLERALGPGYGIKVRDILDRPAQIREHLLDKTWIDAENFREAFQAAEMYFKGIHGR
jgi:hypothetical protein